MREVIKLDPWSIVKVATPIAFGSFTQFLIVFADNYFLAKIHTTAFNAVGNSSLLYIALCMFAFGLSSSAQILIARRNGEQKPLEAGKYFKQALLLVLAFAAILFVLGNVIVRFFLDDWLSDAALVDEMRNFLNIRMYGFWVYFPLLILNALVIGVAKTRIIYLTAGITAAANILLDYGLIFGHFGLPELGLKGAAIASFGAEVLGLIVMLIYLKRTSYFKSFRIGNGWSWRTTENRQLLRLGFPLMLQQILSLSTWTVFFFLVERLGAQALKISHIVRNLYILNLIAIHGIGYVTRTYVSTLIAEERQNEIKKTLGTLAALSVGGVLLLAHGFWFYPDFYSGLFANGDQALIVAARAVLPIIPFPLLTFAVGAVFINALEGAGHTKKALLIEITAISLYFFYILYVIVLEPQSLRVVWFSDYIYFGVSTLFAGLFIAGKKWKYKTI